MATRWRPWVPKNLITRLIRIMEWRPFNRILGKILFEQYIEPKNWSVNFEFNEDDLKSFRREN
jgi:hypothetical protein